MLSDWYGCDITTKNRTVANVTQLATSISQAGGHALPV